MTRPPLAGSSDAPESWMRPARHLPSVPTQPAGEPAGPDHAGGPAAYGTGANGPAAAWTVDRDSGDPDTAEPDAADRTERGPAGVLPDVIVAVLLLTATAWLTGGLWPDPGTRTFALDPHGQIVAEWMLAHATRLWAGEPHLVTPLLNAPSGVNLLHEPSFLLLTTLLAPVTLAFGAPVSMAVIAPLNLAATGFGWYLLLSRTARLHRLAAAVAGAFTALAPGAVSLTSGHPGLTAGWLVPAIVWCATRLARAHTAPIPVALRTGAALGLLIVAQYLLSVEILVITGWLLLGFGAVMAVLRIAAAKRALPRFLTGFTVAVGGAVLVLAYPASRTPWSGVPGGTTAEMAHVAAISPLSLAGTARHATDPALAITMTSFGLPLLLVAAGAALWLWRRPVPVACAVTAVVTGGLAWLPATARLAPPHFALALIVPIAVVLAVAVDAALSEGEADGLRVLVPVTVIAALVPLAPRQLPTTTRDAVPRFFTQGYWRGCVPRGGVLLPVPPPSTAAPEAMRWAAAADDEFALPQGSYVGAGQAVVRPTARLLDEVAATGVVPPLDEADLAAAHADLAYWHVSCVVLANPAQGDALRSTVDALLGPGRPVADVWTWSVRPA